MKKTKFTRADKKQLKRVKKAMGKIRTKNTHFEVFRYLQISKLNAVDYDLSIVTLKNYGYADFLPKKFLGQPKLLFLADCMSPNRESLKEFIYKWTEVSMNKVLNEYNVAINALLDSMEQVSAKDNLDKLEEKLNDLIVHIIIESHDELLNDLKETGLGGQVEANITNAAIQVANQAIQG